MRGADDRRTGRARTLRRAQTDAERRLWHRLSNRGLAGHKFVRQEPIGPYVADFCCRAAKLVVELDGGQHVDSAHDRVRDAFLTRQGYRVLRFWNPEVFANMNGVLDTILAALAPSPLPAGGERAEPPLSGAKQAEGEGEGLSKGELDPESPPHPRSAALRSAHTPARGCEPLSPQAGRGEA